MKIVLPTLHVRRSAQAVSLAAGCLAAALQEDARGSTVLLDAFTDESTDTILKNILDQAPDLVAFPVYVWNRQRVVELAVRLRQERPRLWLVAGGPEATGDPEGLMTAAPWDAVVHGEGEWRFAALVAALTQSGDCGPIPGVTLRSTDEPMPALAGGADHALDDLPSPWLSGMLAPTPQGGVLWEVSRGCAFACDYCFEARAHTGVRSFSRDRLTAELELFSQIGVTQVWVLDSTFNYPPERGVRLLELLLATAPGLHYHLEAKADFIDRHTAALLGRLSCSVQIGLQSSREEVLRTVHRPLDLETLATRVRLLEAEGVVYGFDLIYGLPQDNYAGFTSSLDTSLGFAPNHVHIFPLAILPGTRLAEQRGRYDLVAQPDPPYQILRSRTWSEQDLANSRQLAAVVDIFYNTGRAVAFFPALLHLLDQRPSRFFEDLIDWARAQPGIDRDGLLDSDQWTAEDAYRLQQGYLTFLLKQSGKAHLITAVLDLLCYHFHYAETLLGEDLQPPEDWREPADPWQTPWQRARQLRLVPFAYEVLDLLEMEEMELEDFASLFRPVGSTALFLRRGDDVICESLSEEFVRLLKRSDGSHSPAEIFAGTLPEETGREMVAFAISEGLLEPVGSDRMGTAGAGAS